MRAPLDLRAVERFAVLRFAVLRLAVLRLAVLRFAVLRFAVLRLAVLRFFAVPRFAVLRLAVLRFAVLRFFAVPRLAVLRFAVDRFAVERFAAVFFFDEDFLAEDFLAPDFFAEALREEDEREELLELRELERDEDRVAAAMAGTASAFSMLVVPHVSSAASAVGESLNEPEIDVCDVPSVPLQSSWVINDLLSRIARARFPTTFVCNVQRGRTSSCARC